MMRMILAALMLIGSVSFSPAAKVPLPQPRPLDAASAYAQGDPKFLFPDRTQAAQAPQATPPAPTPIVTPPTVTPQTPAVVPAGTPVVVQVPAAGRDIHSWIQTTLIGILTILFGKVALFPAKNGAPTLDHSKVGDIVKAALSGSGSSAITDPALRDAVDVALLRAVQSGIPGTALQTGLSLIPGAGPFATTLEPMVRKIVIDVLQQKTNVGSIDPAAVHAETDQRLASIEGILKLIVGKVADKPATPVT